jgi:hypothetical protein
MEVMMEDLNLKKIFWNEFRGEWTMEVGAEKKKGKKLTKIEQIYRRYNELCTDKDKDKDKVTGFYGHEEIGMTVIDPRMIIPSQFIVGS